MTLGTPRVKLDITTVGTVDPLLIVRTDEKTAEAELAKLGNPRAVLKFTQDGSKRYIPARNITMVDRLPYVDRTGVAVDLYETPDGRVFLYSSKDSAGHPWLLGDVECYMTTADGSVFAELAYLWIEGDWSPEDNEDTLPFAQGWRDYLAPDEPEPASFAAWWPTVATRVATYSKTWHLTITTKVLPGGQARRFIGEQELRKAGLLVDELPAQCTDCETDGKNCLQHRTDVVGIAARSC